MTVCQEHRFDNPDCGAFHRNSVRIPGDLSSFPGFWENLCSNLLGANLKIKKMGIQSRFLGRGCDEAVLSEKRVFQ